MSLYLGRIGRRILNYTVMPPRLNRVVDAFGKAAHKATFGRYTPGLTREAFLLYQRTSLGDKINVKDDGFYREGEKIAGNNYISARIILSGVPDKFQRTADDTPEIMAKHCRINFRSTSYLESFRPAIIATMFFSLPDIILRVAVNATIPAWYKELTCEGYLQSSHEITQWKSIAPQMSYSVREECLNIIPERISINDIEFISNFHYDLVGDYVPNHFLTNFHHYVPLTLGCRNVAVGLTILLLTGIVAYGMRSEKLLRNFLIVVGSMGATSGLVNGAEILINGYATDYLHLTDNWISNTGDLYGIMASLGISILAIALFYKGIKSKGAISN